MDLRTDRRDYPSRRFWFVVGAITLIMTIMVVWLVDAIDPPGGDLWAFLPVGLIPVAADLLVARWKAREQAEAGEASSAPIGSSVRDRDRMPDPVHSQRARAPSESGFGRSNLRREGARQHPPQHELPTFPPPPAAELSRR